MEFLAQLWLPIVVSGVVVFFMSALVWTVMPHHKKDWRGLPNEEAVLAAMRTNPPAPGQYAMPFVFDPRLREDPAMKERIAKGPNGYFTVISSGSPAIAHASSRSCGPRTSAPRSTSSPSTSIPGTERRWAWPRAAFRSPRTPTAAPSPCPCSRA